MPKQVVHRFGIDVYLKGKYRGTKYVDVQVQEEEENILLLSGHRGERLHAQNVLADMYALVSEKAREQEEDCYMNHEYPYFDMAEFEDYSFKIFA